MYSTLFEASSSIKEATLIRIVLNYGSGLERIRSQVHEISSRLLKFHWFAHSRARSSIKKVASQPVILVIFKKIKNNYNHK